MEKNIREKLNNLRFGHGFLDMTSIAYEIKVKIDMWDDIRLKNVFFKDKYEQQCGKATCGMGKMFANVQ